MRFACSPVNLLRIFRTPFPKNTSGWLLVDMTVGILADVSNISNVSKYLMNSEMLLVKKITFFQIRKTNSDKGKYFGALLTGFLKPFNPF